MGSILNLGFIYPTQLRSGEYNHFDVGYILFRVNRFCESSESMSLSLRVLSLSKSQIHFTFFVLSRIESIFAMEVLWDDRHQLHTSLPWKLGCHGNQSETSITHLS